ncbi:unnamed protein product, partial [Vitis vinifera]
MALGKSNKLSQTAVLKQILKRCSSLGKKQEILKFLSLKHWVVVFEGQSTVVKAS